MVCVTEALSTEKDGVKTGPSAPNSKKGACDLSELRIETGERKSQPWGSLKTRYEGGPGDILLRARWALPSHTPQWAAMKADNTTGCGR